MWKTKRLRYLHWLIFFLLWFFKSVVIWLRDLHFRTPLVACKEKGTAIPKAAIGNASQEKRERLINRLVLVSYFVFM